MEMGKLDEGSTFQGNQELDLGHGKSIVFHSRGVTWAFGYAGLEFCRASWAGDL